MDFQNYYDFLLEKGIIVYSKNGYIRRKIAVIWQQLQGIRVFLYYCSDKIKFCGAPNGSLHVFIPWSIQASALLPSLGRSHQRLFPFASPPSWCHSTVINKG